MFRTTLTLLTLLAGLSAVANQDAYLSTPNYLMLSTEGRVNYLNQVRGAYTDLEISSLKDSEVTSTVSPLSFWLSELQAADLDATCTIGGQSVDFIGGRCSTLNNNCDDPENPSGKDNFQCGPIHQNSCVPRIPTKNLSKRCKERGDTKSFQAVKLSDYYADQENLDQEVDLLCNEKNVRVVNKQGCDGYQKSLAEIKGKFEKGLDAKTKKDIDSCNQFSKDSSKILETQFFPPEKGAPSAGSFLSIENDISATVKNLNDLKSSQAGIKLLAVLQTRHVKSIILTDLQQGETAANSATNQAKALFGVAGYLIDHPPSKGTSSLAQIFAQFPSVTKDSEIKELVMDAAKSFDVQLMLSTVISAIKLSFIKAREFIGPVPFADLEKNPAARAGITLDPGDVETVKKLDAAHAAMIKSLQQASETFESTSKSLIRKTMYGAGELPTECLQRKFSTELMNIGHATGPSQGQNPFSDSSKSVK